MEERREKGEGRKVGRKKGRKGGRGEVEEGQKEEYAERHPFLLLHILIFIVYCHIDFSP